MPKTDAAWAKTPLSFGRNFALDAVAATKYWRAGTGLLAKLPSKPKRTRAQQLAAEFIQRECRYARERFLAHHANTIYRKLTKNLGSF